MAPSVQGAAAYKKKDGTLSISKDQKSLQWQPVKTSEPAVAIAVADITSRCFHIKEAFLLLTISRFAANPRDSGEGDAQGL